MKIVVLALLAALLCGCSSQEVYETVADEQLVPVMAQPGQITVRLPGEAALPVMENDSGRLYLCQGYEIALQTLTGGDVDGTLRTLTGYGREEMTVLETLRSDMPCYEFTWACAGEGGDQIGQGILMDDGSYHYCMTVLWDTEEKSTGQTVWSDVFASFDVA